MIADLKLGNHMFPCDLILSPGGGEAVEWILLEFEVDQWLRWPRYLGECFSFLLVHEQEAGDERFFLF